MKDSAPVISETSEPRPLGITLGDPHGVGPEILLKSIASGALRHGFKIFGHRAVLQHYATLIGVSVDLDALTFHEPQEPLSHLDPGRLSASAGKVARDCIVAATQAALSGSISGMVTLPVNKEAVQRNNPSFSGHTELIGELCGASDVTIMLVSDRLLVTHVSTHVSLRSAIDRVKRDRVLRIIQLTASAVDRLRPGGRLAVAGLNPHAGENGLFGREEIDEIAPAVGTAQQMGIAVDGPVAPDTVFHAAVTKGKYAAIVCMYHDQGHIPLKLLDFDSGVNVTLGLPIVRTSVDHGTAFDIAGTGRASTTSFVRAYELALNLTGTSGSVRSP